MRPMSLIGRLATSPLSGRPWLRRGVVLALALVLAFFTLFPERYRTLTTLTPTDPQSLNFSGPFGGALGFTSLLGNQAALESNLRILRSRIVRQRVIKALDLVRTGGFASEIEAERWLDRRVDIRSMRGGIIQIETKLADPALGVRIVNAYADAARIRLTEVNREQTAFKRRILDQLYGDAETRFLRAQAAFNSFRRRTRFIEPETQLEEVGSRVTQLQAQIQAREVELRAAQQFGTNNNLQVQQIAAQIAALRGQLAEARQVNTSNPNSLGRAVTEATEAERLQRDLELAQTLYESYRRFNEGLTAESLAAIANIRVLEPGYVDTDRQINFLPGALLLALLLLALAIEFYALRPPLEARRAPEPA